MMDDVNCNCVFVSHIWRSSVLLREYNFFFFKDFFSFQNLRRI